MKTEIINIRVSPEQKAEIKQVAHNFKMFGHEFNTSEFLLMCYDSFIKSKEK